MGNPVDEFLKTKEAALQQKRENELKQLELWKQTQQPEHLAPLLKSFEPVVAQKLRQYKAPTVSEPAFKAHLQKQLIGAFQTFDPGRGAQLSTHVENRLMKAQRFNTKFQNLAYIPEGKTRHIGKINKAQDELAEQFGRPPTHSEIADHLGMPPKQVSQVISAQRKDIPASTFESDPTEIAMHRDQEVLDLLPYNLTADEKQVFNHIFGRDGATQLSSTNQIASRLGKTAPQVSRLRSSILKKYQQYK
jgi:DNA-directed RNA polymerase specialized sigma subunit